MNTNETSNRVILIGHLGQDPEIRTFGENKKLAKLSLAVHAGYRTVNGETTLQTEWHNVVAWGNLADLVAEQFFKGNRVSVEGRLTSRSYTGKDGLRKFATEIVADTIKLSASAN
jgi:single-strand DNA-binding protein